MMTSIEISEMKSPPSSLLEEFEWAILGFDSQDEYISSRLCTICADEIPDSDGCIGCESGIHNLCLSCAIGTINSALNDRENVHPEGIRCAMYPRSLGGCPHFLTIPIVQNVHKLSLARSSPDESISEEQISRLENFVAEENIMAAGSGDKLMLCPSPECGHKLWIDSINPDNASYRWRCPSCNMYICANCRVPYHMGLSCDEYQAYIKEGISEDVLTKDFVAATTKPCPECTIRTSHFHGHECHHIRPGGGCSNCHTHWCYACGASDKENIRLRGDRKKCRCAKGYWSTYCDNKDIKRHLKQNPYPYDERCGCPICPECKRGKPCPSCFGECVVCLGIVPPGPNVLLGKSKSSNKSTSRKKPRMRVTKRLRSLVRRRTTAGGR